ncbi:MAG: sigma-54-dependent transcriptional regulator [Vagococcus sp.]
MKRIDRIYDYVQRETENLSEDALTEESGVTTKDVSDALNIQRSNASKDLNALVREGVLDKLDGRPVRYVSKAVFRHKPFSKYVESYREGASSSEPSTTMIKKDTIPYTDDIFKRIIGTNGSMKNSMEQAKAAILYPPRGLNCLIIGPTGSGKTYFAHTMYQFARQNNIVEESKDMIVFNCADYASNPELLMSHLFGHVKGAFTGADEEKDGLISLADGSFLFLDEIHRLPPEGQEMIFYFMDNGTYAKLGETTKNHQANVRIICATTEDPTSSLLNTFVRRIPITIQLPNFKDRPSKEKIDLVRMMMAMEAKRIQRKITLTEDVVKALIGSVSYGNVGQLKSNVQLVTARAFLNHMDRDELVITIDELNDSIKDGLISLAHNRQMTSDLSQHLTPKMVISPNEPLSIFEEDSYELPYNLYDIIGDKAAVLKADGFNQDAINHFISTDINVHLKSFYRNHGFTFDSETKLAEIVDASIIDTTRAIFEYVKEALDYKFQSNFLYAMGLHISSFLIRLQSGELAGSGDNENIKNMVMHYEKELEVAKEVKKMIERDHRVEVPESEVHYLTILLVSLKETNSEGRIGIVVAAHGNSTASSMVQVVSQLLKVDNLRSVDMPLEMKPKEAYYVLVQEVKEVDEGSGVLLLVDMGSLVTFAPDIQKETGIEVRTVDMVTTSIVLEAARKATLLETRLDTLHDALTNFHGYSAISQEEPDKNQQKQAIIAICASGQGTAQRMKELIDNYLTQHLKTEIKVFPISIVDLEQRIRTIEKEYHIIATTGITNPEVEAPFIPMDVLFSTDGYKVIDQVLTHQQPEPPTTFTKEQAQATCYEYLKKSFTFINPDKLMEPLWELMSLIVEDVQLKPPLTFYVNLCMHTAGAIERELRDDTLTVDEDELERMTSDIVYQQLLPSFDWLKQTLQVTFSRGEQYYMYQIVKKEYNTQKDTLK